MPYILIEPAQFPDGFQELAHLAVAVAAHETGLPVGADGEIDGPVDDEDRAIVEIVENLLDLVYSGDRVPAHVPAFLRSVLDHISRSK